MQSNEILIHDIKPLLEVTDYSLYYFITTLSVAILLACGTLYLLYVWLKRRNKFNLRKEHKKLLNAVYFEDVKRAAYEVTMYGATFKNDSSRHVEMYKNLTQRLEIYKYKKEIQALDKETLSYFELYKGMCDV